MTIKTNTEFVGNLKKRGVIKTQSIIDSFYNIDRKDFVLDEDLEFAYIDSPLYIGFGQTISQPSTVAFMLELLQAQPGEDILDIGSGSGWTTALLGNIVGVNGSVLGLERIDELVNYGNSNIKKYKLPNVKIKKSGKSFGIPGGQFDKILVSAGTNEIPKELIGQLKNGGIMVIPINEYLCKITKISKNKYSLNEFGNFAFVPLIKDI